MRKIRIICVGRNQKSFVTEGLEDYQKRILRYCGFQTVFVKDASYQRSGSNKKGIDLEGKSLRKFISNDHFTVACDEKGTLLTSVELSKKFIAWANRGYSHFDFIVGGAYGLSREVKAAADFTLSFSPMTLTHQLVRLILSEQIYRALTIINGERYHH